MPMPLSTTPRRIWSAWAAIVTVTLPPAGVNLSDEFDGLAPGAQQPGLGL